MTALQAPKTARRISEAKMSARGRRPGHKIGRNGLRYWVAKQVVRDPMDYPDQCIALPLAVDEQTIDTLCQESRPLCIAGSSSRRRPEAMKMHRS